MNRMLLIALFVAHTAVFAQAQTGIMTGQVRGLDGQPAAGIRVAIATPNADGQITSDTLIGITITDQTGHYRIDNVPPGRYGIIAGVVASPTFYPGTVSSSQASIVTIARGSTNSGLDFALVTAAMPQTAAQDAIIRLNYSQITTQMNQILAQPSQMIAGKVVLDGPLVSAFLPILKINFVPAIVASPSTVSLISSGGGTVGSGYSTYNFSTIVKADGSFKLDLKPTGYRISIERSDGKPLAGFIVTSITLGASDLLKEELKVNGAISGEIVIALKPILVNQPIK